MNECRKTGESLKRFRKVNHYSQSNIADYLRVDQSLISKVEAGERSLSADMLEKLACLYGVAEGVFGRDDALCTPLSFSLRAQELTSADLEVIGAINKIALNSEFMAALLKGAK